MKNELLKYLKSYINNSWLQLYRAKEENKQEIIVEAYSNSEIYHLTQAKLSQIERMSDQEKPLTIFIVESEPIDFITAFFAGIIAESNIFLCDPAWQQGEWQQVLKLVKPDLVYSDRNIHDLINNITAEVNNSINHEIDLPAQSLIMMPTGGTSGKIKFAMHSWDTLKASVIGFQDYFACQKINSACTLPLYHVSGLMQLMRSLLTQGKLAIFDYKLVLTEATFFDPRDYFISLVPTQLQVLIKAVPNWLSQFKTVLLGGAPAKRSLLTTARQARIPVSLTYGMTETASGIVILKPEDFLADNNSNGRVLSQAQVEIVCADLEQEINQTSEEFKHKPIKSVEEHIGLIKIKSKSLCLGYYPQFFTPEKPLLTDDLGYFDSEGYLYLIGRNSHKIITGGKNVFPAEIEAAIYATNLVQDVCVIGIPDPKWGQAVTAIYIPLQPQQSQDSITQKIQLQLAKYKQPKHWIAVSSLPYNNRGKINYQQLQAIALQALSSP